MRPLLLVAGLLLMVGCSSTRLPEPKEPIVMPLLPVQDFGTDRLVQQVTGRYGDNSYHMLCAMERHSSRFDLVGLSAQGIKLFSMQLQNGELKQQRSLITPDVLQPRQVMADIQLAIWPEAAIRTELNDEWHLESAPLVRKLFHKDRLMVEVRYSNNQLFLGEFTLIHHQFGYSLQVKTLEAVDL